MTYIQRLKDNLAALCSSEQEHNRKNPPPEIRLTDLPIISWLALLDKKINARRTTQRLESLSLDERLLVQAKIDLANSRKK